ncbi:MAG: type II secretion system minor pseudopilin GspJ [Gammaproteobacteria bacterium]|nr:type II secretion system minor pseudopilin GspJ [Gammaproteobacteria bacterium]
MVRNNRGFTLIELLVAMTISMVLALMTYGGFQQVQTISRAAAESADRLSELQMAMRRIEQDVLQSVPRPVRDPVGDNQRPAFFGDMSQQYRLELSRGGWSNPLGHARSTQERIAYFLEDDQLIRRHWLVMDATLSIVPVDTVVLQGVRQFDIRFMDESRNWASQWPPLDSAGPAGLRSRPLAVEITLDVDGFGRLERMLEVRG